MATEEIVATVRVKELPESAVSVPPLMEYPVIELLFTI
jgi:hypothetical protein